MPVEKGMDLVATAEAIEEKASAKQKRLDAAKKAKPDSPELAVFKTVRSNLALLAKGVEKKENRYATRALRQHAGARKKLTGPIARSLLGALPESCGLLEGFTAALGAAEAASASMQVEEEEEAAAAAVDAEPAAASAAGAKKGEDDAPPPWDTLSFTLPEHEAYALLALLQFVVDAKAWSEAQACSTALLSFMAGANRRSLDVLVANTWFFHSLIVEGGDRANFAALRPQLLAAHRTSVLRHDDVGAAMYITLLLRNFLLHNLVAQANVLISKANFPESASNNQFARYFFCLGRIKAIELEYDASINYLNEALRKAPTNSARGFRLAVTKLTVTVQLLKGEIPERSTFASAELGAALAPYLALTRAVRQGTLLGFEEASKLHEAAFVKDETATLVARLRHNVIKAGLRKIAVSYKKIHVKDIASKLHLESVEDAEFIIAKAIRDGVIDATVDLSTGILTAAEAVDVYSTNKPQELYHDRIRFCLNTHNEALQAMRYPDEEKKEAESVEQRRERLKQEAELAAALEDEEDDF